METRELAKGTIVKLIENEVVLAEVEFSDEKSNGKGLIYMVFDKEGDNVSLTSGCLRVSSRDLVEAIKVLVNTFTNAQEDPSFARSILLLDLLGK